MYNAAIMGIATVTGGERPASYKNLQERLDRLFESNAAEEAAPLQVTLDGITWFVRAGTLCVPEPDYSVLSGMEVTYRRVQTDARVWHEVEFAYPDQERFCEYNYLEGGARRVGTSAEPPKNMSDGHYLIMLNCIDWTRFSPYLTQVATARLHEQVR